MRICSIERCAGRPELACHRFADDGHGFATLLIGAGERPAGYERCPQDLEVLVETTR